MKVFLSAVAVLWSSGGFAQNNLAADLKALEPDSSGTPERFCSDGCNLGKNRCLKVNETIKLAGTELYCVVDEQRRLKFISDRPRMSN